MSDSVPPPPPTGSSEERGITVLLINWNSTGFFAHLVPNLRAKANRPDALVFRVIDNTNGNDPELDAFCRDHRMDSCTRNQPTATNGSESHAHGLARGLAEVQTPYTLIIDPDVYVFCEGWDDLLIAGVSRTGTLAAGAPYPAWKLGKYHDFPSPILCFAATDTLRELGGDWRPFYTHPVARAYAFVGRQIVRLGNLGSRQRCIRHPWILRTGRWLENRLGIVGPDTGFLFAKALRKRKGNALLFEEIYPTHPSFFSGEEDPLRDVAALFELYALAGWPFMTHMGKTKYFLYETDSSYDDQRWFEAIKATENVRHLRNSE